MLMVLRRCEINHAFDRWPVSPLESICWLATGRVRVQSRSQPRKEPDLAGSLTRNTRSASKQKYAT